MPRHGIFGWDLPPGCTQRDIDEAFGSDQACPDCGLDPADCTCPLPDDDLPTIDESVLTTDLNQVKSLIEGRERASHFPMSSDDVLNMLHELFAWTDSYDQQIITHLRNQGTIK